MMHSYITGMKMLFGTLLTVTLLTAGCMPASEPIQIPEDTRIKASSTEGYYTDRVAVSWSAVEKADKYIIYRSLTKDGPFTAIAEVNPNNPERRVENAEESITVYPAPVVHPPDWIDPRYLNVTYTTEVDLSGNKFIAAGQEPKLRVIIGNGPVAGAKYDFVAPFPTLSTVIDWGAAYTRSAVVGKLVQGAGAFICEEDPNTNKFMTITSTDGPIALINEESGMYTPVDYFIKNGVSSSQMLIVNKDGTQVINRSDFTGNMADYFGSPLPPDPDPAPIVIMRNFPEGNVYYYDDQSTELGVHYFYRVIARDANDKLLSMSTCNEGYYISANASGAPKNVTVSQGEFDNRVTVSWDPVSGDGITYKIYRTLNYPGTFDTSSPLAEGVTEATFDDTTIGPGVYAYRVVAFNSAGEEGKPSDTATGFRKVTVNEFVHLAYYETVVGEQRTAQALGVSRVADYDSGANADVTLPGFLTGTINYRLVVSGMSGNGKWTFTDYSNFGLTINGTDNMDSGASKDGDLRGKLYISGPYPGYLDYFLHVNAGDVAEGSNSYFMVQLHSPEWMTTNFGTEEVKVPYSTSFKNSPY